MGFFNNFHVNKVNTCKLASYKKNFVKQNGLLFLLHKIK
jgi:hypothetical protein